METAVLVLVSGVVGLFGVTSAVLGFIAEAKRLTPEQIHVSGRDCVYPANPAHTLGVCATFLLVVAEIIASAAGGCCGCCRTPPPPPPLPPGGASSNSTTSTSRRRVVGIVASVLSWVAAVIAVIYYLVGATLNAPQTRPAKFAGPDDEECYYLRGGVFVRGTVLSLAATALAIMSFVLLRRRLPDDGSPPVQAGGQQQQQHAAVIGLPQWPAAQGYGGPQEAAYPPPPPYPYTTAQGYYVGGQAPDMKVAPPPAQGQEHTSVV